MVWSVDGDDSSLTLSNLVSSYCNNQKSQISNNWKNLYTCSPLPQGQKCWWTPEDGIPANS
jgi:hypothetical protein